MTVRTSHPVDPFLIKELLPCYSGEEDRNITAKAILNGDLCYTMMDGKEVVAIMGGTFQGNQVFCWALVGKKIEDHRLSFYRHMKNFMYRGFKETGLQRLYTTVNADNQAGIDQNLKMGLTKEGVLRKAGMDGQDLVMFSLVRGDHGC